MKLNFFLFITIIAVVLLPNTHASYSQQEFDDALGSFLAKRAHSKVSTKDTILNKSNCKSKMSKASEQVIKKKIFLEGKITCIKILILKHKGSSTS